MAYNVTLVQFNGSAGGIATNFMTGFPSSFDFLLTSMWVCLPNNGGQPSNVGVGSSLTWLVTPRSDLVRVTLSNLSGNLYNATFSGPVLGQRYNVLVSVDCSNQIVQVYVNDSPASLISGGWVASGSLGPSSGFYAVDLGSAGGPPAVADVWQDPPLAFVDLSVVGNRRKFITARLAPVDLGANGSNPFGSPPQVFLTVPSGGVASDFQNNYGTGAALSNVSPGVSLTLQTPGTCTVPEVPSARPLISIIGRTVGTPPP